MEEVLPPKCAKILKFQTQWSNGKILNYDGIVDAERSLYSTSPKFERNRKNGNPTS